MVPISIDCPISTSSCFTINSFARPISFFVAPLATEHISAMIQHKTRAMKLNGYEFYVQKVQDLSEHYVPFTVLGLSSCLQAIYRQAANMAS